MARRRFLVPEIRDERAELRGADARHLVRVLRATPGRQYEISDGARVCLAEVDSVAADRVTFRVVAPLEAPPIPVRLTLLAALIKFDRFEWLIEKATELGASAIIPVDTARSERSLAEAARKRVERWRRIAHLSSQQARRLRPPEIAEPQPLSTALLAPGAARYFLDELPGAPPLLVAISGVPQRPGPDSVALLTGAEGGWTDAERAAARAAGWTPVSLGPLILRAETAAIAAAAILLHTWWATRLE